MSKEDKKRNRQQLINMVDKAIEAMSAAQVDAAQWKATALATERSLATVEAELKDALRRLDTLCTCLTTGPTSVDVGGTVSIHNPPAQSGGVCSSGAIDRNVQSTDVRDSLPWPGPGPTCAGVGLAAGAHDSTPLSLR